MLAVSTHNTERPGLIQLYSLLRADATAVEHPAHEHHRLQYDGLRIYLTRAFEEVRAAGELNSDEDSDTLASTFLALMDGLQIQWLYNREATDIDRVLRAYMKSVVPSFPQTADGARGDVGYDRLSDYARTVTRARTMFCTRAWTSDASPLTWALTRTATKWVPGSSNVRSRSTTT